MAEKTMDAERVMAQVGTKLRDLRKQNGLTQQELADRAELTKGFISQLEQGQVTPSLVTLFDLIECLGTTPSDFFKPTGAEKQSNQMEPVLVTIQPHSALPTDDPHNGEEFGYVLSGRIALYRQETRFDVKAGESFYYEADRPHRIENPGSRPAKVLWVSTPPSF